MSSKKGRYHRVYPQGWDSSAHCLITVLSSVLTVRTSLILNIPPVMTESGGYTWGSLSAAWSPVSLSDDEKQWLFPSRLMAATPWFIGTSGYFLTDY